MNDENNSINANFLKNISNCNINQLQEYIDAGADVNYIETKRHTESNYPLFQTIMTPRPDFQKFKFLVEQGAKFINYEDYIEVHPIEKTINIIFSPHSSLRRESYENLKKIIKYSFDNEILDFSYKSLGQSWLDILVCNFPNVSKKFDTYGKIFTDLFKLFTERKCEILPETLNNFITYVNNNPTSAASGSIIYEYILQKTDYIVANIESVFSNLIDNKLNKHIKNFIEKGYLIHLNDKQYGKFLHLVKTEDEFKDLGILVELIEATTNHSRNIKANADLDVQNKLVYDELIEGIIQFTDKKDEYYNVIEASVKQLMIIYDKLTISQIEFIDLLIAKLSSINSFNLNAQRLIIFKNNVIEDFINNTRSNIDLINCLYDELYGSESFYNDILTEEDREICEYYCGLSGNDSSKFNFKDFINLNNNIFEKLFSKTSHIEKLNKLELLIAFHAVKLINGDYKLLDQNLIKRIINEFEFNKYFAKMGHDIDKTIKKISELIIYHELDIDQVALSNKLIIKKILDPENHNDLREYLKLDSYEGYAELIELINKPYEQISADEVNRYINYIYKDKIQLIGGFEEAENINDNDKFLNKILDLYSKDPNFYSTIEILKNYGITDPLKTYEAHKLCKNDGNKFLSFSKIGLIHEIRQLKNCLKKLHADLFIDKNFIADDHIILEDFFEANDMQFYSELNDFYKIFTNLFGAQNNSHHYGLDKFSLIIFYKFYAKECQNKKDDYILNSISTNIRNIILYQEKVESNDLHLNNFIKDIIGPLTKNYLGLVNLINFTTNNQTDFTAYKEKFNLFQNPELLKICDKVLNLISKPNYQTHKELGQFLKEVSDMGLAEESMDQFISNDFTHMENISSLSNLKNSERLKTIVINYRNNYNDKLSKKMVEEIIKIKNYFSELNITLFGGDNMPEQKIQGNNYKDALKSFNQFVNDLINTDSNIYNLSKFDLITLFHVIKTNKLIENNTSYKAAPNFSLSKTFSAIVTHLEDLPKLDGGFNEIKEHYNHLVGEFKDLTNNCEFLELLKELFGEKIEIIKHVQNIIEGKEIYSGDADKLIKENLRSFKCINNKSDEIKPENMSLYEKFFQDEKNYISINELINNKFNNFKDLSPVEEESFNITIITENNMTYKIDGDIISIDTLGLLNDANEY